MFSFGMCIHFGAICFDVVDFKDGTMLLLSVDILLFWQLIAVIASIFSLSLTQNVCMCVYIWHYYLRMAMKNCFPTFQQKDLLFVTLAFISRTNHLVCPRERSMCHMFRCFFVCSLNGIGLFSLFRHFGLTIGFCIRTIWFCMM